MAALLGLWALTLERLSSRARLLWLLVSFGFAATNTGVIHRRDPGEVVMSPDAPALRDVGEKQRRAGSRPAQ